ncbi:AAA family ATPase [Chloroflexota bacterium]
MSGLALYLLGAPRIERDGLPIKLGRRKAIGLLAYLAVTGESHRRDTLVNLLWPEVDAVRGRAALRRTLYTLRKALTGDWLEVDREEIGLRPRKDPSTSPADALWVDVDRFHRYLVECETHGHPVSEACPACLAPLTDAVALVRGDFLSGFGLKDSFNFDDWQLFQAEVLRRELAGALERLVGWYSTQHEFDAAAGYARRRLQIDPLDEPAHRQLMRLYNWSGQRSAALRQYEECSDVLGQQLGVPPQDETTALHHAIQAGSAPSSTEQGHERDAPSPADRPARSFADLAVAPPAFLKSGVPVERPVFVSRERELARLDGYLNAALAGQGRVVFVTGEAGSGKTTLIQEFTRKAQEAHVDLIAAGGSCSAYTGIGDPYLPFREILELLTGNVQARWAAGAMTGEHARRLWNTLPLAAQALLETGSDLIDTFVPRGPLLERAMACASGGAEWLTRLDEFAERDPYGPGMPGPQQSDLFKQYTGVLQVLARQLPLVLVLDDLQWADLGSISLLFHLGRQLVGSHILVVGAYRLEEVAIGVGGERHPLEPLIHEFQRSFGDITVDLGQAETRGFAEALLDSEPNRLAIEFRDMLYQQTRGHPLFTVELLRGLQERGDLILDREGRWVEGSALDWETLPARVEAVIAERVDRLPQPLRAALRVACVEGEVFTAEVVARVQAVDGREVVGRLSSELDRRHRLVRAQAIERLGVRRVSRYRFSNHLFQKYLYDKMDPVELAYLHESVGNALEVLYRDQPREMAVIAPQLAWHFQEAGIADKAIHYLLQAGDRAVQLSAYQEGIAHLNRGLALLSDLPDSPEHDQQELALQLALGMAWKGPKGTQSTEAELANTRARELCQQMGKTSQLSRVVGELAIMYYVRAEHQRARAHAEEALSLAHQTGDPLLVGVTQWHLGVVLFGLGEYSASHTHLEQVIAFYNPEEHHRPFLFLRGSDAGVGALAYDACCLWCLGYPEQALRRSQEALALARELGHPFSRADVLCYAGCNLSEMRRDALALRDHAEELMRVASETSLMWWPQGQRFLGSALAMLGQVDEGMAQMKESIPAIQSNRAFCCLSDALCHLAQAQAAAGRPEEGLVTLAEALAFVEQTDQRLSEAELHRIRAELLLRQGDAVQAESSLHKAIEAARRQSARSWELRATTSLARLWQEQGRRAEARGVLAEIYGWFTEGFDTADLREAQLLLEELS